MLLSSRRHAALGAWIALCTILDYTFARSAVAQQAPAPTGAIYLAADSPTLASMILIWYGERGEQRPVPFRRGSGYSPGEVVVSFECRAGTYVLQSKDLVSAPLRIDADGCRTAQRATMFPAAQVQGIAVLPAAGSSSSVLLLTVGRCGVTTASGEMGSYPALVERGGAFRATVPAGCVDLTARLPPYAPARIPAFRLAIHEVRDVGRVVMKPGASLVVQVVSGDGTPVPGALVSVVAAERWPVFLRGAVAGDAGDAAPEALSDMNGVAGISGLSPGLVFIAGRSRGRIGFGGPVELREREQTLSPQLVVRAGGAMRISAPDIPDATLSVRASPEVLGHVVSATGVARQLASTDKIDLPFAGRWRLQLVAMRKGIGNPVEEQYVDVPEGGEGTVAFATTGATYDGRVFIGERTVAGVATLQRLSDENGVMSAMVQDDGRFSVWLPSSGEYSVAFIGNAGTVRGKKATVNFVAGVTTTIRYSVGQVAGAVVDEDGSPAGDAMVSARLTLRDLATDPAQAQIPMAHADAAGQFVFESLDQGAWELEATVGRRRSRPLIVDVPAGAGAPPVRLVLAADEEVTGRVVSSAGNPVVMGIGFYAVETGSPTTGGPSGMFRSDDEGYFTLRLGPYGGSALQAAVSANDWPLAVMRVRPEAGRPLTIRVPSTGGQVRLVLPPRVMSRVPGAAVTQLALYALVSEGGAILPLIHLLSTFGLTAVNSDESTTIVIPSLATGMWRVARFADVESLYRYVAGLGSLPAVRQFAVNPGQVAKADLR